MKIGQKVKALSPCDGKSSIQFEIGKVIYIGRRVLVEFFSNVCGHNGNGIGKNRYCWMIDFNKLQEV